LKRYVADMAAVMSEVRRVLKNKGTAIFVVGDCNVRGTFVANSRGIEELGRQFGLRLLKRKSRKLPENRRYLPPPGSASAGLALERRMRKEIILTFRKERVDP